MATLGQQLKAAREAKGVSEQEAGAATKILTKTIVAMEADDFSGIAAPTYAKGFIRLYARYLSLNPDPLIDEYLEKHVSGPKTMVDEQHQLEKGLRESPSFKPSFKWFSASAGLLSNFRNLFAGKDVRALAAGTAGLLVLILLIVSATNCVRRQLAEKSSRQPAEAAARMLLDKPLPDLYLVEPRKIESSR